MTVSMIVAMSRTRVIGHQNQLPWRLPADLQYFRQVTLGKPVIMGRKTYASIGRLLPGRENYIISRDANYRVAGARIFTDLPLAIAAAGQVHDEVMVIGGAEIYQLALPLADSLYVTLVDGEFAGDAWFPELLPCDWQEMSRQCHEADDKNPHPYCFIRLHRVPDKQDRAD